MTEVTKLKLAEVIFFSAEHPKHKVNNLRTGQGRWTGPPKHEGDLECEFALATPARITRIEIGNYWSACVEVSVGLSSWPSSQRELFVRQNFMNRLTSVSGQNSEQLLILNSTEFEQVSEQHWDRIRVVCKQPYRFQNDCFGLSLFGLTGVQKPSSTQTASTVVEPQDLQSFMEEKIQLLVPRQNVNHKISTSLLQSQNSDPNRKLSSTLLNPNPKLSSTKTNPNLSSTPPKPNPKLSSTKTNPNLSSTLPNPNPKLSSKITNPNSNPIPKLSCKGPNPNSKLSSTLPNPNSKLSSTLPTSKFNFSSTVENENSNLFQIPSNNRCSEAKENNFYSKATEFLRSCNLEEKDLAEVQNITFNNIKAMWSLKHKVELSKEEKSVLKEISRQFIGDLVERLQSSSSHKRKNLQSDAGSAMKKRKINSDCSENQLGDAKRNHRNALATIDLTDNAIGEEGEELETSRSRRKKKYRAARLLDIPCEILKQHGVLVQAYNYKKNKDLPLRGGETLGVRKQTPVLFYKVGPHIHLVYEGRVFSPDVQPEHQEKLFKDYDPPRVHNDEISAGALALLTSPEQAGRPPPPSSVFVDCEESTGGTPVTPVSRTLESTRSSETTAVDYGECPLCGELFPYTQLQEHASLCEGGEGVAPLGACPLCGESMEPALLPLHAAYCGSAPNSPANSVSSRPGTPLFGDCPVCESRLLMSHLTEHAAGCQGFALNGGNGLHVNIMDRQVKCDFCLQLIPEFVIDEHVEDCPARGVRTRIVSAIEKRNSAKFRK